MNHYVLCLCDGPHAFERIQIFCIFAHSLFAYSIGYKENIFLGVISVLVVSVVIIIY